MSKITVFGTQTQWEGNGQYFVSGSSTSYRPGSLSYDPLVAYCLGTATLASGSADTTVDSSSFGQYVWRARYTSNYSGSATICLERENDTHDGWLSSTLGDLNVHIHDLFSLCSINELESVDLAISPTGLYYVLMETPSSSSVGLKDVYLYTNDSVGTSITGLPTTGSFGGGSAVTPEELVYIKVDAGISPRITFTGV